MDQLHQVVDHAKNGVEHHVLPGQCADDGHDQEGRDEHGADDAPTRVAVVDQLGIDQPDDERQDDRAGGQNDGIDQRRPEHRIGSDDEQVIVEPGELEVVGSQQVPAQQAVPDRQNKWELRDDDGVDHRRRDQRLADRPVAEGPDDRQWRRVPGQRQRARLSAHGHLRSVTAGERSKAPAGRGYSYF